MRKSTLFSAALSLLLGSVSAYGQSAGDVVYVPGERVATLAEGTNYFIFDAFEKSPGVPFGFLKGNGSGVCPIVSQLPANTSASSLTSDLLWTVKSGSSEGAFGFRSNSNEKLLGERLWAAHTTETGWVCTLKTDATNLTSGNFLSTDGTFKSTSEVSSADVVFEIKKDNNYLKASGNNVSKDQASAHPYAFYTAVEKTYIGVTYIYSGGDAAVENYNVVQLEGSAAYAPEVIGYRNIYDKATINKDDADEHSQLTINVTLQRDYDSYVRAINRWLAVPQGAVGSSIYAQQNAEDIQAKIAAYEANKEDTEKQAVIKTLYETIIKGSFVEFAYGKYYRFYSAEPTFRARNIGLSTHGSDQTGHWRVIDEHNASAIFYVEPESDNTSVSKKVYVPNFKNYLQGPLGAINVPNNTHNTFSIESLNYHAQYKIHYGGYLNVTGNPAAGSGSLGADKDGTYNSTSAWYIVPVTEIEVALNQVGDFYYGTVFMPFSVRGADLYKGRLSEDKALLTMSAVDAETVVAQETGLVVKSASDKVVLSIEQDGATLTGNSLTGTLLVKAYANATDCVVLGLNEGNIGFYSLAEGVNIPANKAYLELTALGAVRMQFDGETTDIEGVSLADGEVKGNAPIFDLTGRRVQKTVKGGLYIQGGQKFIAR